MRRLTRRFRSLRRDVVDWTGWTSRRFRSDFAASVGLPGNERHVLIAPPGAGNIGDQAMVEAFLAAADLPVTVVTRGADDFALPVDLAPRATILPLADLFYGQGAAHRDDVVRLACAVDGAATVSIVGADIMDGVYVLRPSLRRSSLAAAAAKAGFDSTVLGFSWNSAAPRPAWASLRRAGAAGARLLLRDPASAARVRDAGIQGAIETADIVFTDDRVDAAAAAAVLAPVSGPYVLVNCSGLIARKLDQVPEYVAVIGHFRARGLHVVLLPHVVRSTADDLTACRAVFDAVGADGVTFVQEVLAPSTIRALAQGASLTVTGRMHLAVMSLSQGIPSITLATQGKVEGLMRLFGWPELCVTPRAGMADEIVRVADAALDGPDTSERIRRGAASARELAGRNIVRIGGPTQKAMSPTALSGTGARDG
ncbi:polysaccharide pyruvyl transferase family protein [Microbacterium sp.]|uniref:polysaccharide pyruvyl transferase family protein n=1 Tax=Microbacterium sp. TaxID=51671 RepID=UPI002D7FE182|nr:polysaccharide pyruvyl transferase family protein [Microbacterium sp.]